MKKAYIILTGLFLTILGLIIVNITLNNFMSTQGIAFGELQTNVETLQRQNVILEAKVLQLASLTKIASQAATMGFTPDTAKTQIALSDTVPLAYNNQQ